AGTRPSAFSPHSLSFFGLTALVVALLLGISAAAPAATTDEVASAISRQVVSVDVLEGKDVIDSHSGVVFARDEVAVPCNSIAEQRSVRVRIGDATKPARIAHRDILRNLCLVRV